MERTYWIYLVHPMSGLKYDEVEKYYTDVKTKLEALGYHVLHPMVAKKLLQGANKFDPKANHRGSPIVTPHAITRRDHWMVRKSDIVFADLTGSKDKSIGSISEISSAYELGKHTIGIMEKGNIHEHAFMFEQFDIIFDNLEDGIVYLTKLIRGEY